MKKTKTGPKSKTKFSGRFGKADLPQLSQFAIKTCADIYKLDAMIDIVRMSASSLSGRYSGLSKQSDEAADVLSGCLLAERNRLVADLASYSLALDTPAALTGLPSPSLVTDNKELRDQIKKHALLWNMCFLKSALQLRSAEVEMPFLDIQENYGIVLKDQVSKDNETWDLDTRRNCCILCKKNAAVLKVNVSYENPFVTMDNKEGIQETDIPVCIPCANKEIIPHMKLDPIVGTKLMEQLADEL